MQSLWGSQVWSRPEMRVKKDGLRSGNFQSQIRLKCLFGGYIQSFGLKYFFLNYKNNLFLKLLLNLVCLGHLDNN